MRLPAVLAAAAGLLGAATVFDYNAEGKLWWAHIQYLADDQLEGRNVGTEGFHKAVQYVATQFERYGLKPAGTSGYLQPIPFESRLLVEDQSSLVLVRGGAEEKVTLGAEATLSARADLAPSIEAPMVFAGYGMVIPKAHYNDLAGLDVKGKIVVYVNALGPVEAPGPLKSHYSSGVERWDALRKEKIRSLDLLFSSSRLAPPSAASKPCLSIACLSATVFITSVCTAEPWVKGPTPARSPSSLT